MAVQHNDDVSEVALRRVFSEFIEMPGLRITCPQGQRLWGLDEATCRRLLDLLVEAKFLCRLSRGTYSRLSDGPSPWPQTRMTKACISDSIRLQDKKAV